MPNYGTYLLRPDFGKCAESLCKMTGCTFKVFCETNMSFLNSEGRWGKLNTTIFHQIKMTPAIEILRIPTGSPKQPDLIHKSEI